MGVEGRSLFCSFGHSVPGFRVYDDGKHDSKLQAWLLEEQSESSHVGPQSLSRKSAIESLISQCSPPVAYFLHKDYTSYISPNSITVHEHAGTFSLKLKLP